MYLKFESQMPRIRTKQCFKCSLQEDIWYRCRYDEIKYLVFLCGNCLIGIKVKFENTYQYGGTWKGKKK